jgi:hypothetical protein
MWKGPGRRIISRSRFGTTIAEVPLGLYIVFIGMAFPVFVLAILSIRFAMFWEAAREAAEAACQCQTYQNNADVTSVTANGASTATLSAVNQALLTAQQVASIFPGVTIGSVQTWIVKTPVSQSTSPTAAQVYGPGTALGVPADTQQNMYQIRVIVSGQVQPIVKLPGGFLGRVPGATQPIEVTVSEDRVFENPGGLNS